MPFSELTTQGLELLFLGMAVSFGFMAVLHLLTGWMSRYCAKYEPCHVFPIARPVPWSDSEQERVAAIAAAIHQYRTRHPGGVQSTMPS